MTNNLSTLSMRFKQEIVQKQPKLNWATKLQKKKRTESTFKMLPLFLSSTKPLTMYFQSNDQFSNCIGSFFLINQPYSAILRIRINIK